MTTLEQAIEHCYLDEKNPHNTTEECSCGIEHAQLARWLEELKALRDKNKNLQKEIDSLRRDLGHFL